MIQSINSDLLIATARQAGAKILEIYEHEDFSKVVDMKADNSPLTMADHEANKIIVEALEKYFPEIPIISEEEKAIPYETRKNWSICWLVDPLDGTKEFIKRNGEFTVNIALIENGKPVLGVIYAPVPDIMYFGKRGQGAWKEEEKGKRQPIQVGDKTEGITSVESRSHASDEDSVLSRYRINDRVSVGSSLKFCSVAEGKADIYYRHGPTMEWDTAAGQAILEAAGGSMHRLDGTPFTYNKENLLNPGFICLNAGLKY
jgi:3'(2'), 5'-bisphosphate nucleotidase